MTEDYIQNNPKPTLESLLSLYPEVNAAYTNTIEKLEDCKLEYHNLEHTLLVTNTAIRLAQAEEFSQEEIAQVATAALYHDFGYIIVEDNTGRTEETGHTTRSAQHFREFATQFPTLFTEERTKDLADAIEKTNMAEDPPNKFARILRDADLAAFAEQNFIELNDALRQECRKNRNWGMHSIAQNPKDWAESQLKFVVSHKWFTNAARELLDKPKKRNIKAFIKHHEENIPEELLTELGIVLPEEK